MYNLLRLWESSGLAQIEPGQALMILVGLLLLFLASRRGFEPLLLLTIGFGATLAIPFSLRHLCPFALGDLDGLCYMLVM